MSEIDKINNMIKVNKKQKSISTKEISDGNHTFGELHEHRIILFCTLCNLFSSISWKSKNIMMKRIIQCLEVNL